LTGLPSAGKSTLARGIKKEIIKADPHQKVKIIDPDIIRNELTGETFDPSREEAVRNKNLHKVEKFLQKGYIVISDDLNYYSSMRHDLREIADKRGVPFFIVYVSTPLDTCLQWNEGRGTPIPNEVIYKVNEKFDYFDKYEWDTPDLTIDLSTVENRTQEITAFLENVKKELKRFKTQEKKTTITSGENRNLYHEKLDVLTRETVAHLLEDPHYRAVKSEILKGRKKFVKKYLNRTIPIAQIPDKFKAFLERKVDIKFE
jgi:tRNA uridine 5-carbamoylmethylation protein Kti12